MNVDDAVPATMLWMYDNLATTAVSVYCASGEAEGPAAMGCLYANKA